MKSPSSGLTSSNSLLRLAFVGLLLLPVATIHAKTTAKPTTYPEIVRLSYVQGDVRFSRGDRKGPDLSKPWEQAVANLPILANYSIATGNGRAEIEFEYGSTLYLAENSVLLFRSLSATDGVPYTEMELVTGTATVSFRPIPKEVFSLLTPTEGVPFFLASLTRVDSYLDGATIQTHGDHSDNATLRYSGTPNPRLTSGQAVELNRSGPVDWDGWVAARVKQRQADTAAALKASGLTSFVPGLTDLYNEGKFFSCAPFGMCWEPKELPETQQPPAAAKQPLPTVDADGAAAGSFRLVSMHADSQQTDAQQGGTAESQTQQKTKPMPGTTPPVMNRQPESWEFSYWLGQCPAAVFRDIKIVIDPLSKKQVIVWENPGETWALCHSGAWIYREGGYTFVVGKKRHHPPIRWIHSGNKVGYVPRHPSDVKGNLPLNLKYGLFIPKGSSNSPFERVDYKPSKKYRLLSEPPKEFRDIQYPQLSKAERPEIQGHLLAPFIASAKAGPELNGKKGDSPIKDFPIKYDYKTRNFVQAGTSAGEGTGKPVVVGSLTARGGHSSGFGGGGRGGSGGSSMHSGGASSGGRSGGGFAGGRSSSGGASSGGATHSGGKQ